MKHIALAAICGAIPVASSCAKSVVTTYAPAGKPNVIFVLADDLGYGDLGCYGQKIILTPNLDRMAENGMRFTQFYAGSTVSAPSRSTLMTGLHSGHGSVRGNTSGTDGYLTPSDRTMAQMFLSQGYATGMFGKWGLGMPGTTGAPEKMGFQQFLGYTSQGAAHKYYPETLVSIVDGRSQDVAIPSGSYSHDFIMDGALDFIRGNRERPFFLYMPVTIPHAGMEIPPADLKYVDGEGKSLFEETPFAGKSNYAPQSRPKAVYASMVTRLDADMGRLFTLLTELGLDENTLVIFTSDNGPHSEGGYQYADLDSSGGLRGHKRDFYEGGIREPFIARWPGVIAPGTVNQTPYAMWDIFPTMAAITGGQGPEEADGISMLPALEGNQASDLYNRMLYWEILGKTNFFMQAARWGDWKMVRFTRRGQSPRVELYDLASDPAEKNDLSAANPDVVGKMAAFMEQSSTAPKGKGFAWQGEFIEPGKH